MSNASASASARSVSSDQSFSALIQRDRRRKVLFAILFIIALGVYDVWAMWPYLSAELGRLEPWKVAGLFIGDAVAVLWFIGFLFVHFVRGKALADRPVSGRAGWAIGAFAITLFGGMIADLGFSTYLWRQEAERYAVATEATANVLAMRTRHASEGRNWTLQCAWVDPRSRGAYRGVVRVHVGVGKSRTPFPRALPADTVNMLDRDQMPPTVPIRFDPTFPARVWLQGVPDDQNGLFFVSLFILLFQAMGTMLVLLLAVKAMENRRWRSTRQRMLPWWIELGKALPTAVEAMAMALPATLMLVFGD